MKLKVVFVESYIHVDHEGTVETLKTRRKGVTNMINLVHVLFSKDYVSKGNEKNF